MGNTGKSAKTKYKVNAGISYPPGKRAEPGDVVDDIPASSVPRLLERKIISKIKGSKTGADNGDV